MQDESQTGIRSGRAPLRTLDGTSFDVAVIGGGVSGASAAQHLSAAGYSVLLVEQQDYGAATSSRSSKLLHLGLAGLAPAGSPWEYALSPRKFLNALRTGREQALARTDFTSTSDDRVNPFTFYFPIFADSPYSGWQIDVAFALLRRFNKGGPPLDYQRLNGKQARKAPLLSQIRDSDRLTGGVAFREYQFEWPERVVVDSVLDARRMGAVIRNYTRVTSFSRSGSHWALTLQDQHDSSVAEAKIKAEVVLNFTGTFVDEVNKLSGTGTPHRLTTGSKGVHIMVQLDPELRNKGLFTEDSRKEHFYIVPWRGMHYIGPTDTVYKGDLNTIHPSEQDIGLLLEMSREMMPGLPLKREDVVFAWAGVRPRTYDPAHPKGTWSREIHDMSEAGMPGVFALTGSTLGRSRHTGRDILKHVQRCISPSGAATALTYPSAPASVAGPGQPAAEAVYRHAILQEQACSVDDILFRRSGSGWDADMGREEAPAVARILAEQFGWDQVRIDAEVKSYLNLVAARHALN